MIKSILKVGILASLMIVGVSHYSIAAGIGNIKNRAPLTINPKASPTSEAKRVVPPIIIPPAKNHGNASPN